MHSPGKQEHLLRTHELNQKSPVIPSTWPAFMCTFSVNCQTSNLLVRS